MRNFLVLLFVIFGKFLFAQVSIAPTAIFLDKNGIGSLYITNSSSLPQEITVSFQFGYSDQDENGVLIMVYDDSNYINSNNLQPMIKAFPRTFNLAPNSQQLVRIQARVPKSLKDGTYFTRVKVGSSTQAQDVEETIEGVGARVGVRFEQVIVAFYKHGNVNTSFNIERLEAKADSNFLSLRWFYKITGNSPYIGKVRYKVTANDGKLIAEGSQSVSLYFQSARRLNFLLSEEIKPGKYDVEFTFETKRNDIAAEDLIQVPTFTRKMSFVVN